MKDAPHYSDSEKVQEKERKKIIQQEHELRDFKEGVMKELASAYHIFYARNLKPSEKLDAFAVYLSGIAEMSHSKAREMEG